MHLYRIKGRSGLYMHTDIFLALWFFDIIIDFLVLENT